MHCILNEFRWYLKSVMYDRLRNRGQTDLFYTQPYGNFENHGHVAIESTKDALLYI